MKTPSPADSDTLVQDAAHWCMRLHAEDLSEEERGEFQRWLAADPRHAAEYAEMEEIWALSELLPRTPAPELRNHAATRPFGRRRRGWKSQARAAALALLMLPTAGYLGWLQGWIPSNYQRYEAEGNVRHAVLPDGSEVELDAQSAIDVAYDSRERRVRLLEGSAIFRAAPRAGRETRPFVVESAGGSTRALGTRFLVSRNDDGSVQVGVLEHRVAVALAHPRTGTVGRRELGEGESLRYSAEGGVEAPLGGRLDDLTSWRRGLLVFDEQPLGEVVARLNRYRPGHLLVAPGALAQRRVSGVFRVADLEASLQSISDELGVRSLSLAGVTLLY